MYDYKYTFWIHSQLLFHLLLL